jgi:hypothetical protein
MSWEDKKNVEILVDLVREESDGGFNGIFTLNLLNKCWSLDNKRIIFSSQTGHNVRVLSCDVDRKVVSVLDQNMNKSSLNRKAGFGGSVTVTASVDSIAELVAESQDVDS